MHVKTIKQCRICGNTHFKEVIDLGMQHIQGAFKKGELLVPTRLVHNKMIRCDTEASETACGLVQMAYTVPPEILYSNYWYQSGITQTMRNHLSDIVANAKLITGIKKGNVLDIACNDGFLLRQYGSGFKKVGVDPSDVASRVKEPNTTIINSTFPTNDIQDSFDIITSIAVLYDIDEPHQFVGKIKRLLKEDGVWCFEVAYLPSVMDNLCYDGIVNEHVVLYHLATLERLLKRHGFKIFNANINDVNGGSIQCWVCHDSCKKFQVNTSKLQKIRMEEFNRALDTDLPYQKFCAKVRKNKDDIQKFFWDAKDQGKTVHLVGASTKINTLLEYCNIGPEYIQYASERTPEKIGAETLSGIKIISEEESRAMKPDYYFFGPWHFKEELLKREKATMDAGTKLVFPLPKLEIY